MYRISGNETLNTVYSDSLKSHFISPQIWRLIHNILIWQLEYDLTVGKKLWLSIFCLLCKMPPFFLFQWVKVKVAQSCPTLCDPMVYTVLGILQTRILEWVAFPFSRYSQPRDRTQLSHMAGRLFTSWATREAHIHLPYFSTQWYIFSSLCL